jgi:hypothetical protein
MQRSVPFGIARPARQSIYALAHEAVVFRRGVAASLNGVMWHQVFVVRHKSAVTLARLLRRKTLNFVSGDGCSRCCNAKGQADGGAACGDRRFELVCVEQWAPSFPAEKLDGRPNL